MLSFKRNYSSIFLVLLILLSSFQLQAQTIKGFVTDATTGEPMTGATVLLKETGSRQYVQLDGKFTFKNVTSGDYNIIVTYTNYEPQQKKITVTGGNVTSIKFELKSKAVELSNVVIRGSANSDATIRSLEKNSNQIANIVSSRNMELLPDITVANVMRRVSGVTIENNSSGEARYPIIRGMEKRYINTLVNGIKIPSPDNMSRFIPLDLFPSELLERLEVSKSLTPSMEGDAIGGTI
ncbi:MAG: TonB-dependent receptor, partial [Bacteroidota bacterium]|nr:TonB-dependent receptor [Bacteroidota bacterium]